MFTDKEVVYPGIVMYKNAIPKELDFVNRVEASLDREDSPYKWVGARVGYFEENLDHRNCQDFKYKRDSIGEENEYNKDLLLLHDQLTQSMQECLADYAQMYGVVVRYQEAINLVKYGPGQKFNHHSDDGDPYRCTVSVVGYPNDNYDGGELDFQHFQLKLKPEAGTFVVFPSAYIYAHASLPVQNGIKYSVVVMNDRNELGHRTDSPLYYPVEERPVI